MRFKTAGYQTKVSINLAKNEKSFMQFKYKNYSLYNVLL